MNHRGSASVSWRRRAAGTALLALAVLLAPLSSWVPAARAAPHSWTGGHNAAGWAETSTDAYFAEGTTRNGFEEYLILLNPRTRETGVRIEYQFPPPERPKSRKVTLAAGEGKSICVNDEVGWGKNVSIAVRSEEGIVSERQVYFNYKGVWTGGHVTRGAPSPGKRWYFAEGTTREGFVEWLCLQNPGRREVSARITYLLGTGRSVRREMLIGAGTRETIDVAADVGPGQDVSIVVEASGPVVAERPMYFDYHGIWRGGHTVTGSSFLANRWYFAEGTTRAGFETWLTVLNPGEETDARVRFMFGTGESAVRYYRLKARARTTISVNDEVGPGKDVSLSVETAGPVLCERPVYFVQGGIREGGHVVIGANGGRREWLFPTASVGEGFDSWLCLMNPGDRTTPVVVEVFGKDGGYNRDGVRMGPRSRFTVNLNAASAGIDAPWVRVTAKDDIVAERPTYFSYVPRVESRPVTFATWGGIEIKSPVRYSDLLGFVFHEAAATLGDGGPSNAQVMQPVGICLRDDNPSRLHHSVSLSVGSDPAYFIEDTRSRGTYSTTACDVMAKKGSTVYAPVDGVVLAAEGYLLYGKYPDLRVRILIDGRPGYHVAVLHMDSLSVSRGQRVEAGVTPLGTVRDLVGYFRSGACDYTREEGNHAHVEIDYRPDMHL